MYANLIHRANLGHLLDLVTQKEYFPVRWLSLRVAEPPILMNTSKTLPHITNTAICGSVFTSKVY